MSPFVFVGCVERDEIGVLKERAERVLGRDRRAGQAVIGGMPVLLQTNSHHAANFWSRNWFLTDRTAVEEAGRRHGIPCVKRLEEARPVPRRM